MATPVFHPTFNPSYYGGTSPYRSSRRGRFGTSATELFHLATAVLVLTTAIVLWMMRGGFASFESLGLLEMILVAFGVTVTGFALHEVAHKVTAQHYGHWSEFRYSAFGLFFALLAGYLGVLFAAPGATWHTASSARDNGKISAAGPLLNVIISLIAFPFTDPLAAEATPLARDAGLVVQIATAVMVFNTILAAFNLIPLGPLDGKKVLAWNPLVYGILVAIVVLLIVYTDPFQLLNGR